MDEDIGIWRALRGDGTFFIVLSGLALCGSGAFALFLTFTGQFLPHDAIHIGFTAGELALVAPNLAAFMFHDRAAFGGALIAIGSIYLWLAAYPLKRREPWSWWTLAASGLIGFGSFLSYIGYGYLDTWHGLATLLLIPVFLAGMYFSGQQIDDLVGGLRGLRWNPLSPSVNRGASRRPWMGLLLIYALGLMSAGSVIAVVGMTGVFVPQDIRFIGLCRTDITAISERLIPVIAHDRAGFGGALLTTGVTIWFILHNARPSRSLWELLLVSGLVGFSTAIGIHYWVGYTDFTHLAPAYAGALIFTAGITRARTDMLKGPRGQPAATGDESGCG